MKCEARVESVVKRAWRRLVKRRTENTEDWNVETLTIWNSLCELNGLKEIDVSSRYAEYDEEAFRDLFAAVNSPKRFVTVPQPWDRTGECCCYLLVPRDFKAFTL
jgi:hypothetical protein